MTSRFAVIFLIFLSACAAPAQIEHRQKRVDCPPVALDTQLQTLTRFDDTANPMQDRPVSTARLTGFESACTLNARALIVDMRFGLEGALITPSDKSRTEPYPYVLAVSDKAGKPLLVRYYNAALTFPPGMRQQSAHQVLREAIPLQGHDPALLQIAVGFAVTSPHAAKGNTR